MKIPHCMIVYFSHDQMWKIVTIYSKLHHSQMFLGVMEGVQGVWSCKESANLAPALALAMTSRMKQEIGNVKIIIK